MHPFIFPPGHRLRICNFVSDVKLKLKTMSQVSSHSCGKKKRKLSFIASKTCKSEEQGSKKYKGGATFVQKESDTESDSDSKPASLVVASQVRTSIGKWAKKQRCAKLRSLKENKEFSIIVSSITKSNALSVSVRCSACNSCVRLGLKNGNHLISNWTRHAYGCKKLHGMKETCKETTKQFTLSKFLSPVFDSPSETSSCSESPISDSSKKKDNCFMSNVFESPTSDSSCSHISSTGFDNPISDSSCKASQSITDWSRNARAKQKLEQIGNEGDQTHILDYFAILDDIGRKMKNSLPYYSKT